MVYLDTSAAVPLFVPEPTTDAVEAWFATCTERVVSAEIGAGRIATADANLDTNARRLGLATCRF